MKDDPRYNLMDCFETFPFPPDFENSATLEFVGKGYHDHRAALMIARNEGMTKTYNRFHNRAETSGDIQRLRDLHVAMDRAVLEPMAGTISPRPPLRSSSTRLTRTITPIRAACSGRPTSATKFSPASSPSMPNATPKKSTLASLQG